MHTFFKRHVVLGLGLGICASLGLMAYHQSAYVNKRKDFAIQAAKSN
jgi:hypothetical protein